MNTQPNRPPGLVAVIVITGVFAVLGLFICGPALLLAGAADLSVGEALLLLVCFALSVAEAVVCYGLWKRETWGLGLAQNVYAIGVLVSILSWLWADSGGEAVINLVSIGAYVWMIVYVNRLKGMAPLSVHAPHDRDAGSNRPPS